MYSMYSLNIYNVYPYFCHRLLEKLLGCEGNFKVFMNINIFQTSQKNNLSRVPY